MLGDDHGCVICCAATCNGPISMDSHVCNWNIPTCMPFSSCSSKIDKLVQIE